MLKTAAQRTVFSLLTVGVLALSACTGSTPKVTPMGEEVDRLETAIPEAASIELQASEILPGYYQAWVIFDNVNDFKAEHMTEMMSILSEYHHEDDPYYAVNVAFTDADYPLVYIGNDYTGIRLDDLIENEDVSFPGVTPIYNDYSSESEGLECLEVDGTVYLRSFGGFAVQDYVDGGNKHCAEILAGGPAPAPWDNES